jgi:RHS repeat-associated protein
MNTFRASKKTQDFKSQHPYLTEATSGVCLQNTYDYSPFGVSLDGRTVEGDFYRSGFNGMEKDDEVKRAGNSYTTFYRQLDPRVGRWFTIDPKVTAFESPFVSMGNNPILQMDPLGDDKYKVNRQGDVSLKRKTKKDYDKIVGKNSDGKRISMETEKGVLKNNTKEIISREIIALNEKNNFYESKQIQTVSTDQYGGDLDQMTLIFEFMAQATKVEWALFKFGSNEKTWKTGILMTSHDESTVGTNLVNSELFKASDFTGHDHIHPGGSKSPSGLMTEKGDVAFLNNLQNVFSEKKLVFRIYTADDIYTTYNGDLFEIKVTPSKNK